MAISEKARHELYEWLRENAGDDRAETMMDLLPPTGWGDVATHRDLVALRRDLDVLEGNLRREFRAEMAELRADISERMRVHTLTMVTTTVAALGFFATVNQILG